MNEDLNENLKTRKSITLTKYEIEQFIVAGFMSCIAGLGIYVGLCSLGIPLLGAIVITLPITIIGVIILVKLLPPDLKGIRKQKPWLTGIWSLLAITALFQLARLSIFMVDHSHTQYSLFPGDRWMVEHCCLTAYSESTRQVSIEENIYKPQIYYERKISIFNVDLYHYPPSFLLLPLSAQIITGGDFLKLRMLWFAISLLAFMIAIGFLIYQLEPAKRVYAIGMMPLIFCSLPMLAGLQMLNVQILVISISIIGMILLPRQVIAGSALLALSIAAKIFPGILLIYLLAKRKYREAAWIIMFVFVLFILAFIIFGAAPFRAFIEYELPRLASGEAFSRPFSRMFAVARNMSPFGIPLKLEWLGVPGMSMDIGRIVSTIYLLGVICFAVLSGKRQYFTNKLNFSTWLSIICLGSLLSPFSPANYVLVPVIILVCLDRELLHPSFAIIIWLFISVPFLLSREAPYIIQLICFLPAQVISIGLPSFVLWQEAFRTVHKKESRLIISNAS